MSRSKENPASPQSRKGFLADAAYRLQRGEFYPDRHVANVQQLCEQFPEYSTVEIDAIYRQACRIDEEAQKWIESSQLSHGAKELLLEWLGENFSLFRRESLQDAIERAIPPKTSP